MGLAAGQLRVLRVSELVAGGQVVLADLVPGVARALEVLDGTLEIAAVIRHLAEVIARLEAVHLGGVEVQLLRRLPADVLDQWNDSAAALALQSARLVDGAKDSQSLGGRIRPLARLL